MISLCQMAHVISLEKDFKYAIKRTNNPSALITQGIPYKTITTELKKLATNYNYTLSVILSTGEERILR